MNCNGTSKPRVSNYIPEKEDILEKQTVESVTNTQGTKTIETGPYDSRIPGIRSLQTDKAIATNPIETHRQENQPSHV